jgi:peptide/nickel transport system substrate-binding protein
VGTAVAAAALVLALPLTSGAARADTTPSPSDAAASPSVAGASASTGASSTAGKVTFTIGILHDVDSLNPFTGIVAESYEAYQMMYDQLSGWSAGDLTPTGQLATAVTPSADGKTWTYTIRPGVTWSDGAPLTAKDIAYTYNRIIKGSYEQTNWGSYVKDVISATAPNDTTVVMTTKVATPAMAHQIVPILPEHIWSKINATAVKSYPNEVGVVGSGPFIPVERKTGQFIRFVANKKYWAGAPKVDEIVFRVFANPDSLAQALKKGEIDFADGLKASVWNGLKNAPGITTYAGKYPGFDELAFNTGAALADGTAIGDGHPALKDKRVRQALNHAIDRDTIIKRALEGHGTPGTTIIPPNYAQLHLTPDSPYAFDLAKANQLLDAAGYPRSPSGIRQAPGGKPLQFRLFARQPSQESQQSAKFIQGWFKEVGVGVDISVLAEDNLTEKIGQGNFDMFEWGWVVEPDPDYQLSVMTCDKRSYKEGGEVLANLSDSFYCNPEFDKLYALQATQVDPIARAATVKKAQQILFDDAPYALLYYYDDLQAYNSKWTGFVPQPSDGGVLLFQYGAWSYPHIDLASRAAPSAGATPGAAGGDSGDGGGAGSGTLVIGGVIAALAVVGGGFALLRRRRGDQADVE